MEKMQIEVDKMYAGNFDAIISNVSSNNDYLVLNAIISGTKQKINNDKFIEGVTNALNNKSVLLGFSIKSFAEASLCILTNKKYTGNDSFVKSLIENEFNIEKLS